MPGLLISGPAGAGKSQEARRLLDAAEVPSVVIDFQSFYAALLQLTRGADGRYPERLEVHEYVLPLVEYLRTTAIRQAVESDIELLVTNSDGSPERRARLLSLMGAGATERIIDPGRSAVEERLTINGVLSDQCGRAIDRWYLRL